MYQPASKEQIKQRRRQLRQQRRLRAVKISLAIFVHERDFSWVGMVGKSTRLDDFQTQPNSDSGQSIFERCDQFDRCCRSLIPSLIIELAPAQLTTQLIERGSIATVKIDRGLLPPHLIVDVQDLLPVARMMREDGTDSQTFIR